MKQYNHYTAEDFTFVVCAYQECEYLEEAIRSVVAQTVKAKIMISTSTPNNYIQKIADRYGIPVRVNRDGGQIKDYNFAMEQPDTPLMMLMLQDEILADSEGYTASVIFEIVAVAYSPNMAFVKNGDDIYEITRVYRPDKSRFIQLTCEARNNGKD